MDLEKQLSELKAELKSYFEKASEQQNATGTVTAGLKSTIDALQKQVDAIDAKIAERQVAGSGEPGLREYLADHSELKGLMSGSHKRNVLLTLTPKLVHELKTTVTSAAVGAATSGVLTIERVPGIVPEARQQLFVRDLFQSRPTTQQIVDFVKVNSPMNIGSPQTEASDKGENAVTFNSVSERIRTLATWIPASRQVLDDMDELMSFLQTSLPYYVDLFEEQQLLSGDGTGQNLHGLIPQAQSFNTGYLSNSKGWTKIDIVGRAIEQIVTSKELPPTFVVLNGVDYWDIRLTKDSYGRYIMGDPFQPGYSVAYGGAVRNPENLWGLTPVVTNNIASGTFLVGSGSPVGAEIRDRMGMEVEIATQHSDFFTKNLIAIRAEKRTALLTKRPNSFITGTFSTSPA